MENFVYNSYMQYFGILKTSGYYPYKDIKKLLVLSFIYTLIYKDYRGYVKEKDYHVFEKSLECLYGTSCLTPYIDYLKMGKLKLGEMTELLERTRKAEEAVKKMEDMVEDNHSKIEETGKTVQEQNTKLQEIKEAKVVKGKTFIGEIPDIEIL